MPFIFLILYGHPMSQVDDTSVWAARSSVHAYQEKGIGYLALNRPDALNALSIEMVDILSAALLAWRADPAVLAVVIYSPHARAFCAGGDIRLLYEAHQRGDSPTIETFFTREYRLNHLIFSYPKPYIALLNGIVMGGGMGLMLAARLTGGLRIAGASARLAMPETKIGLFPDVGSSWFLARTSGALGIYLGLSGQTMQAKDAIDAGLIDTQVPDAALPTLIEWLQSNQFASGGHVIAELSRRICAINSAAQHASQEDSLFTVASALPSASAISPALRHHETAINRHFSQPGLPALLASLESAAQPGDAWAEGDPWAARTLQDLRACSPLALAVTLQHLQHARRASMAHILRTDLNLACASFATGDVIEGIRAAIIDKDHQPAWNPATIEALDSQKVPTMFTSRWDAANHPLAALSDPEASQDTGSLAADYAKFAEQELERKLQDKLANPTKFFFW
jgi:enoyl-CoA hydratase/carnithine racemase